MRIILILLLLCVGGKTLLSSADSVLLLRSEAAYFQPLVEHIRQEIDQSLQVNELVYTRDLQRDELLEIIRKEKPKAVIALDNTLLDMVGELKLRYPDLKELPLVGAMALNMKGAYSHLPAFCGIRYEVSGYALMKGFEEVSGVKLQKVFVMYRGSISAERIQQAQRQLAREQIVLAAIDIEKELKEGELIEEHIQYHLSNYVTQDNYDAVWILADNKLVNRETLSSWLRVTRRLHIPFISSIDTFANEELGLCAYVASPHSEGVAIQLTSMAAAVVLDGLDPEELGVEDNLSHSHVINKAFFKRLGIKPKDINNN